MRRSFSNMVKRLFCAAGIVAVAARAVAAKSDLPIVDLGYERHRAISFNVGGALPSI